MSELEKPDQRTLNKTGDVLRWLGHRGSVGTLKHIVRKGPVKLYHSLSTYGRMVRAHRVNQAFDKRYQIETWSGVAVKAMQTVGGNDEHAEIYAPIPERSFHYMMGQLDVDFSSFSFVDYGSGKGKMLLMASEYPFQKIVGVEFASGVHHVAVENIARYKNPKQQCFEIEARLGDACEFELPAGNCLLFFFAPFFGEVLSRVLENIRQSLLDHPRRIIMCYLDDDVPYSKVYEVIDTVEGWDLFTHHRLGRLPNDPGAAVRSQGSYWVSTST